MSCAFWLSVCRPFGGHCHCHCLARVLVARKTRKRISRQNRVEQNTHTEKTHPFQRPWLCAWLGRRACGWPQRPKWLQPRALCAPLALASALRCADDWLLGLWRFVLPATLSRLVKHARQVNASELPTTPTVPSCFLLSLPSRLAIRLARGLSEKKTKIAIGHAGR